MATYSNSAREVEMPDGNVVVLHSEPTGGANTTSNIKKFKYDDNGHVTESEAADAEDLNLSGYSTPTTGSTDIGASDDVQTAIGKLDHQSHTNQTNILYVAENGVKNICNNAEFNVGAVSRSNTSFNTLDDGTITVKTPSGETSTTDQNNFYNVWFVNATTVVIPEGTWMCKLHGTDISNIRIEYSYILNGTTTTNKGNFGEAFEMVIPTGVTGSWLRICAKASTSFNSSFKVMVWNPTVFGTSPEFQPFSRPNYDLTRLEAEDRAALAEEIDAGAKNILDFANLQFQTQAGTTYTKTDTDITVASTGTSTWAACTYKMSLSAGNYVFSAKISNLSIGSGGVAKICLDTQADGHGTRAATLAVEQNGTVSKPFTWGGGTLYIMYYPNYSGNLVVTSFKASENMICTKAAFGVSQKFVPYIPNMNDYQWQAISTYFLARRSGRTITINGYIANISFTANTATLIGNVNTTVGRPHESVRTLCNVGANAYTVGTLGYLIVQQDGNIYVTTAYEGTGAVYVSLSYTI